MRKFSLMLVTLFCMIFAVQAQQTVTSLSQLSNDNAYTLRSARAFLLYSTARPNEICSSNGKVVGTVTQNAEDPNQQFRIEKKNGYYYLYSIGAEKYVGSNGAFTATPNAALTLENVGGSYPWKLLIGGNGMNSQDGGQTSNGIKVDSWTTTDAGNCYQIVEAGEKIDTGIENSEITMWLLN